MAHFVESDDEELLEYGPCNCGHTMGQHDDEGACEECDCPLFVEDEGE